MTEGVTLIPDPEQVRLLNDLVQSRIQLQNEELDTLDRKATTVLAATGVLLGLVVNSIDRIANAASLAGSVALYGSLASLALGLVAALWTLWPRRIQVVPHPAKLVEQYYSRHPDDTFPEILTTRTQVWKDNVPKVGRKSLGLKFQISLLAVAGVLLTAACILNKVL